MPADHSPHCADPPKSDIHHPHVGLKCILPDVRHKHCIELPTPDHHHLCAGSKCISPDFSCQTMAQSQSVRLNVVIHQQRTHHPGETHITPLPSMCRSQKHNSRPSHQAQFGSRLRPTSHRSSDTRPSPSTCRSQNTVPDLRFKSRCSIGRSRLTLHKSSNTQPSPLMSRTQNISPKLRRSSSCRTLQQRRTAMSRSHVPILTFTGAQTHHSHHKHPTVSATDTDTNGTSGTPKKGQAPSRNKLKRRKSAATVRNESDAKKKNISKKLNGQKHRGDQANIQYTNPGVSS